MHYQGTLLKNSLVLEMESKIIIIMLIGDLVQPFVKHNSRDPDCNPHSQFWNIHSGGKITIKEFEIIHLHQAATVAGSSVSLSGIVLTPPNPASDPAALLSNSRSLHSTPQPN